MTTDKTGDLRKLVDLLLAEQGPLQDGQPVSIGYARVSKDQYGRSMSVKGQIEMIFAEAKRRGWYLRAVYFDNHRSASTYATKVREEFDLMVEDLKLGTAQILVYWEASRTQRDLEVYVPMRKLSKELGISWHYNGNTYDFANYDDQFRTALDVVLSEREVEQMRSRVKGGIERAAKMGLPHGGPCPYGYIRRYDEHTRVFVSQDIDERSYLATNEEGHEVAYSAASVVREIFERLASGDSVYNITKTLNARNIPAPADRLRGATSPQVGAWTTYRVRGIATNPVYIGWRTLKGEFIREGVWKPLIDRTEFDTVNARLNDPKRRKSRSNKACNLLSLIGTCGKCGGRLGIAVRHGASERAQTYKTYICRGHRTEAGQAKGACVSIRCEKLDAYIESVLIARMSDPATLDWLVRPDDAGASALAEQAANLRTTLDKWKVKAASGEVDPDEYEDITKGLRARIVELEAKAAPEYIPPAIRGMVGEQAAQVWDGLTLPAKRDVLRTLMKIEVLPIGGGNRWFDPSRVNIGWLLDSGKPAGNAGKGKIPRQRKAIAA